MTCPVPGPGAGGPDPSCPPSAVWVVNEGGTSYYYAQICDANNVPFIRCYEFCDGAFNQLQNFDLDGDPFVPVEPVGQCRTDFDPQCFTDDSGTIFFGVWELEDGTLVVNFYTVAQNGDLIPYVPTSNPVPCNPNDIEQIQNCWIALVDGVGYTAGDQITEIQFWDVNTVPPLLTATVWYNQTTRQIIATPPPQADLTDCGDVPPQPLVGCLAAPGVADFSNVDRCQVIQVTVNGTDYAFLLPPGWTTTEFVNAFNSAAGGDVLLVNDGDLVTILNQTNANFVIQCALNSTNETFGTGGTDGNRVAIPNTTYTFDNSGPIQDDFYAVTSFQDTGLADFNDATGTITADSTGDVNGNAFIVAAAAAPGEFYRLPVASLENVEYSVSFAAINTTSALGIILPNIRVDIEDVNDGNNIIATFNTGDIPLNATGTWSNFNFTFFSPSTSLEFVLSNNAPGGTGNDLAIDTIIFSTVLRTNIEFAPRVPSISVEIVKGLTPEGAIEFERVWSADGQTEYLEPYDDNRFLITGSCPPLGQSSLPFDFELVCADGEPAFRREVLNPDGSSTVTFIGINGQEIQPVLWTPGGCGTSVSEIGCLSSPAAADLSIVERCQVDHIILDGERIDITLDAGWFVQELVDAVNAVQPGTLIGDGTNIVFASGKSIANLEIVCIATDFEETFGTGGTEGNRVSTTNTNYIFRNIGFILDGEYAITSFQDAGLAPYHTGEGAFTADALGDVNGNAIFYGADAAPGEFYRQPASVIVGSEYTVRFYVANTTLAIAPLNPNITVNIENQAGTQVLQSFSTGEVTTRGVWVQYEFNFVATEADVQFVLVNAGPGGTGNDLAIDQITFSALRRTLITMVPRGTLIPVEIIKILTPDGSIEALRVWSADGLTEYPIPDPDGLVLSTGACPIVGTDDEGCCVQPGLDTEDFALVNPNVLNIAANTAHSVSVYVATGTADINGITFPAGAIRNINGDDGQNNIANAQDIDNITGTTMVTVTRYV